MVEERRCQQRGEKGHSVLRSFPIPNEDLLVVEVDVFHPEAEPLEQPEAGTIEQACDKQRRAAKLTQHLNEFITGENCWEGLRPLGPLDICDSS